MSKHLLVGLLFAGAALPSLAAPYKCHFLEDRGGEFNATPFAINDQGTAVGYAYFGVSSRAVRWKPGGRQVELEPLSGNGTSHAYGVNAGGTVVGTSQDELYRYRATVWHGRRPTALPGLPGAHPGSHAAAVNAQGWVVGHAAIPQDQLRYHATVWRDGQVSDLGTLGSPGLRSAAWSINDAGIVVGHSEVSPNVEHAARWNSAGEIEDLGTLPGGLRSWAREINRDGLVAGESEYDTQSGRVHATVWDANGPRKLGGLSGHANSRAWGLNDAGVVVGESGANWYTTFAVVWFAPDQAAIALNDLLGAKGCTDKAGRAYDLSSAQGVNQAGEIIATGRHVGSDRAYNAAFKLTPEP